MFKEGQKVKVLNGRYAGMVVLFDSYSEARPSRCYVQFAGVNMRGAMLNVADIEAFEPEPVNLEAEAKSLAEQYGLDEQHILAKLQQLQAMAKQKQYDSVEALIAAAEHQDNELHLQHQSSASFRAGFASSVLKQLESA